MSDTGLTSQMADYLAFARSPLWDLQRQYYSEKGLDAWAEAQVPHYVTSHPVMANAYAQIVLGFWRDLKAQGLTGDQPLYIIELGSGCGRFAYHFLLQFFEAFDAIRGPDDRVCYVMTDFSARTLEHWRERLLGRLDPFVQEGRLDFALYDVESDSEVVLQNQGITLTAGSLKLPPVVIANYVFGSIRQDLFFLDKERLYEGWMKVEPGAENDPDQPFAGMTPDYQKRRLTEPGYSNQAWNRLIEDYARRLPPCALLFPARALNVLERLSRLQQDNLLLLSADRGSQTLQEIGWQQTPEFACHGSFTLPVNYPVLADIVQSQSGTCWSNQAANGLSILAAFWHASPAGTWRETGLAARHTLEVFDPNDFYRIKQTLESDELSLSPEQMLAYLRLGHWDTRLFYLLLPGVKAVMSRLSGEAQQEWYQVLVEVWRFHLPIGEDYDLAFDLACLAPELNRWTASIDWFNQSLVCLEATPREGHDPSAIWFNLGIAHWQLANHSQAERCLLKALEMTSDDEPEDYQENFDVRRQLAELSAWQARCQRLLGAQTLQLPATFSADSQAVYASLLGPHQARALYRLQRNPELCRLAGVERLQSVAQARDWLQRHQSAHSHVLGILHPGLGLIGVAALEYRAQAPVAGSGRSARFYYWIGQDHQNQGYGLQAMTLLHQLAHDLDIQHLFGSVERSNASSSRVLAKLGYRALPPTSTVPGYRNYYRGNAESDDKALLVISRFPSEQEPG